MTERMGIRAIRGHIGERVNAAHYLGEPTIVERNGQPFAVLVPYAWWAERKEPEDQGTLAPWRALPRGPSPPA